MTEPKKITQREAVTATQSGTTANMAKAESQNPPSQDEHTVSQKHNSEQQELKQDVNGDSPPTNEISTMNPRDSIINPTAGFRS